MRGSLRVKRPRPSARIARALPALSAQLQLLSRQIAALQAASPPRLPFRDVWAWWKVAYLPGRERRVEFVRLVERDLLPTLGELRELLPEHVEAVLRVLEAKGLGPASVNKRRSALKRVLSDAIANGRWVGANPVLATHPRPVPRRAWPTLSVPEAAALLARPKEPLRALWALALYLGLRKGELFALRRRDVELAAGRIIVARSHERATTKTGKTRVLPICSELRPYLEDLLSAEISADSERLLFRTKSGRQRRRDEKMAYRLRSALKRAGVVVGWETSCRSCGKRERRTVREPGAICCGKRLWWEPVPRPLRFHDLRHSFTTLALAAGVRREVVRMVLGHAGDTTSLYTQHSPQEVKMELEKHKLTCGTCYQGPQNPSKVWCQGCENEDPPARIVDDTPADFAAALRAMRPPEPARSEGSEAATSEPSNSAPPSHQESQSGKRDLNSRPSPWQNKGGQAPENRAALHAPGVLDYDGHWISLPEPGQDCIRGAESPRQPARLVIDGLPYCAACADRRIAELKGGAR